MLQKKRMSGFTFLVVAAIGCLFGFAGTTFASDPTPKFFNPAQERRIQELEAKIAALEAAIRPAQPMQATIPATEKALVKAEAVKLNTLGAPVELAPIGQHWLKTADSWILESDNATAPVPLSAGSSPAGSSPAFNTPVRSFIFNQTGVAIGTCKNGNCPAPSTVIPGTTTVFRR